MSKKELIKFGIKGIDAFQDNYQIFFDRLVRGYKSMTGKDPAGLDLLKVKMEARDKAMQTTKVVDMKGKTLDPDKTIMGGTQEGITGLPKGPRPFGDNIRDAYSKAGRDRKDATEMIEALDSPGAKQSYEIFEEALGVRLYGDETFEELMIIKETGKHPRNKADGGRIGFKEGNGVFDEDAEKAALGKRVRELMDEGFDFGDAVKEAMKEGYKAGGRVGYSRGKLVLKGIETLFSGAKKNKKLTDDEYEDFVEELGGEDMLEAYDFDGTVGSAQRILKEQKDYMDDMYDQYKTGKLDPEPGDKSEARKIFLERKLEDMEMSGDKRLMTVDEIEELSSFDLGSEMDVAKSLAPKMVERLQLKQKYPGITDDLLDKILIDDNVQRKAEVLATMDEAFRMMEKGKGTDEILQTFKNVTRTKQADGGRVGLYRGGGADMGADNTASDTGPGGGETDTGPSFTGDSIGPSAPKDLGFIGGGPTVSPTLTTKGPTLVGPGPTVDPRFGGYTPSTFDPGRRNIFQKGFDLVKRTVTNPFVRNLGFGILGGPIGAKFGLSRQIDMFNKARAVKGLYDSLGPIADQTMEDVLEDETGQTTALYKDGGLVTLFTEKR